MDGSTPPLFGSIFSKCELPQKCNSRPHETRHFAVYVFQISERVILPILRVESSEHATLDRDLTFGFEYERAAGLVGTPLPWLTPQLSSRLCVCPSRSQNSHQGSNSSLHIFCWVWRAFMSLFRSEIISLASPLCILYIDAHPMSQLGSFGVVNPEIFPKKIAPFF